MLPTIRVQSMGLPIGPRIAGALTDPWRLRILMELSGGPLSPSEFVDRAGGNLDHISRCFRQLAELGYIEEIEQRLGRGASIEHVYRLLTRAYFDTKTWEGIPRFQRDMVSQSIHDSFFTRVAEAVNTGTFDLELDRHLSWDGVVLDRTGWQELGAELDNILEVWLPSLEEASRAGAVNAELIPTTIGLAAFRSPQSPDVVCSAPRPRYGGRPAAGPNGDVVTVEMASAMRNRWRARIVMELSARPLSPSQFVREVGGSPSHISRCFRQLAEWGYIGVVAERKGGRPGAVERVYRNLERAYLDGETWKKLPYTLRAEFTNAILNSYLARINDAMQSGTFDADADRHFSWIPVFLSRSAWHEVSARLDQLLEALPDLQEASLDRQRGSMSDLIPTTVGLCSFRSPS